MKDNQKRPISEEEKLLKRFEKKLKLEAVVKSVLIGFVCGFALCIPVSIISFIAEYNTIWIAVGVLCAGTAGFAVAAYMKYYKTSLKKTASRVDGVGLEERMITMLEYSDRDDALAQRQRADAREALAKVEPKHVKIPFPKIAVIAVAVAAAIAITMMVTSTVKAVRAEEAASRLTVEQPPEESDEDRIIREMIEEIRKEINDSNVGLSLKNTLHGMVDDLEESLRPTDSTEIKIAKISETAIKIHKLLQNELSRIKIGKELQKHDTTKAIGVAIESGDMEKIEAAFTEMYDSIAPLVGAQKYEQLIQTAEDILKSLEDAGYGKPEKEKSAVRASVSEISQPDSDALAKALEELAEAMLAAVPPPDGEGEEPKTNDEINKELQDAIQEALGAIRDALDDQKEIESTDTSISDTIKDALAELGFGSSDEKKDPEEEEKKDETSEAGPANPDENGEIVYDSVIDGKTPYMDVYDDYYKEVLELLTSGDLTEEERVIIENYFNILN